MPKRARIGDVVEIDTPKGRAYAQYTHKHAQWGGLLRILPGIFMETPADLERLVAEKAAFSTFFPLQQAIKQDIVRIVGNVPVPLHLRRFPTFRAPMPDAFGGTDRIIGWWLWDGEREWPVGRLTHEQRELPIREVINDTLLVERIVSGWRQSSDLEVAG